jgi:hypothetical protein
VFVQQESYSIRILEDASADLKTDILRFGLGDFSRAPASKGSIELLESCLPLRGGQRQSALDTAID